MATRYRIYVTRVISNDGDIAEIEYSPRGPEGHPKVIADNLEKMARAAIGKGIVQDVRREEFEI